jgi:hypothetical protein
LVLQGCGFTKFIYFEPTPVGFARPHYKGPLPGDYGCAVAPDSIFVPVDSGVTVRLSVRKGTSNGGRYTDTPGITLFGEAFVPSGIRVRYRKDAGYGGRRSVGDWEISVF